MRHSMKITWQTATPYHQPNPKDEKLILWVQWGGGERQEFTPPLRVPRNMVAGDIVQHLVNLPRPLGLATPSKVHEA